MTRERLANRRSHELIDFDHRGYRYTAGIGRFTDGRPAEIFLNVSGKVGAEIQTVARDAAILASLCLQHGATAETIRHAITRNSDGSASGAIGALLDTLAQEPRP